MSESVIAYLKSKQVNFQCLNIDDLPDWKDSYHGQDCHWIRAVLLRASDGVAMAVLPAGYMLDFSLLSKLAKKEMEPVQGEEANLLMKGIQPGIRVPLPEYFNFPGLIDRHILSMDKLWFDSGDGKQVIQMTGSDFVAICENSFTASFALSKELLFSSVDGKRVSVQQFTPMRIQSRIEDIIELPAMPGMALDILKISTDRLATPKTLAKIIERDPSLSAQIIGWACAAYYGYRGKIDSVETAINQVLGYEMVLNMCLGIILGQTLRIPQDGPLGLRNYWRQAILCATLAERLCLRMPIQHRPVKGLVYLSGLLHNIGHLLLAHAFPPHSFVVSRFIETNPHISVNDIEKHVLGVSHSQIGAWLLQSWGLPEEIVEATRWHHQEEYASNYAAYSNLILVANQMIGRLMLGDARPSYVPDAVLDTLGLSKDEIISAWNAMEEHIPALEALADQLAA